MFYLSYLCVCVRVCERAREREREREREGVLPYTIKGELTKNLTQVDTTIFCDVGINLHTKLAIFFFYWLTNQVNELQGIVGYYKFQCIQSVLKIYTILNCPLETHFEWFFRIYEINMDSYVWTSISMLTFKKYCIWGLISTYLNTPLSLFKREVRPIELEAASTVFSRDISHI